MGAKKTFFRADHRALKPGDPILPGDDYIDKLSANHRAVENLIRATLSNGVANRCGAGRHLVGRTRWMGGRPRDLNGGAAMDPV
jgi:hypothetical protein